MNKEAGDGQTADELLPLVYGELRALAQSYLNSQPEHTLAPTALVHEAYIKLARGRSEWFEQNHFFATAATAMRQILVDHARSKLTAKRGGDVRRVSLSIEVIADDERIHLGRDFRVLELDELLVKLTMVDKRASRVAELRIFGGMTQQQIALVLGVSRVTIANDWSFASAWLGSEAAR
ncbi:RNA polymerase subunit sigma-70 [bacterium]|nr:MAG: RNA polymerase subunit sigma-70 [bacterium]